MSRRRKRQFKYTSFILLPLLLVAAVLAVVITAQQAGATTDTQWETLRGYINNYFSSEAAGGDEYGLIYPKAYLMHNLGGDTGTGATDTVLASYVGEGDDMANKPILIDNLMNGQTTDVPGTEFRCQWNTAGSCYAQTSIDAIKGRVDAHATAGFSTDIVDYCATSQTATPTTAGWGIIAQTGALQTGGGIPKVYEMWYSRCGWSNSCSQPASFGAATGSPETSAGGFTPTFPVQPTPSCESSGTNQELVRCVADWAISSTGGNTGNGVSDQTTITNAGQSIDVRPGSITTMSTGGTNLQLPLDTLFGTSSLAQIDPTKTFVVASKTQHGGQAAMGLTMLGYSGIHYITTPANGGFINYGINHWSNATNGGSYAIMGDVQPFLAVASLTAGPGVLVDTAGAQCTGACTGPTITGTPSVSGITTTGATISGWTTNKPTTVHVEYGTTTSYGSTANNTVLHADHSGANGVSLSGLTEGTHYYYRITDYDSNATASTSQLTGEFDTTDAVPPVISNVLPIDGNTIDTPNTTISADLSDVGSGIDTAATTVTLDSTPVAGCANTASNISCDVSGLATGYHTLAIHVADIAGNPADSNTDFTVTDDTLPVISSILPDGNGASSLQTHDADLSVYYSDDFGINTAAVTVDFQAEAYNSLTPGPLVHATCAVIDQTHASCPQTSLANGIYDMSVSVADNSGNTATDSGKFTLDDVGPRFSGIQPRNINNKDDFTISATYYNDFGKDSDFAGSDTSTLQITLDGNPIDVGAKCTIDSPPGSISCPLTGMGLSEGPHTIAMTMKDVLGITGWPGNRTFNVDLTAPTFASESPTGTVSSSSPTISDNLVDSGSGINSASTIVYLDGSDISSTCTKTATNVSCPTSGLANGSHDVSVTAVDKATNSNTDTWSFTVDASAPVIETPYIPANGSWVTTATPLVQANYHSTTTDPIDNATLAIDSTDCGATFDNAVTGSVSCTAPTLAEGPHTVDAAVTSNGHTSNASWTFSVDTIAPDAATNMTPAGETKNTAPVVGFDVSDAGSGVNSIGFNLHSSSGTSSLPCVITAGHASCDTSSIAPLAEGTYDVWLFIHDAAGNTTNDSHNGQFIVDTTAPQISSIAPTGNVKSNDADISVYYSDANTIDTGSVSVTINNGSTPSTLTCADVNQTYASCPQTNLANGNYTVAVSVKDMAGNEATGSGAFTLDTAGPHFGSMQPRNINNKDDFTISASYSDFSGAVESTLGITLDGNPIDVGAKCTVGSGSISCPLTGQNLSEGSHTVVMTMDDVLGNTGTGTRSFNVDLTDPSIDSIAPSGNGASSLQTHDADIAVYYSDGGSGVNGAATVVYFQTAARNEPAGPVVKATCAYTGSAYTSCPQTGLANGNYTVTAYVTDKAGNQTTGTGTFTIDDVGPRLSSIKPRGTITDKDNFTISATWLNDAGMDSDFAGTDPNSITIALDGNPIDVAADCTIDTVAGTISCPMTGQDLSDGSHAIDMTVKDVLGITGWPGHRTFSVVTSKSYFWTWYDNASPGAQNWILMANPKDAATSAAFDVYIAGNPMTVSNGIVPAGQVEFNQYPVVNGPVRVDSTSGPAVTSQRSLWAGNSLEEIAGTVDNRLTDHYYWSWYDQKSPGYQDWVLIANPDTATDTVTATISFTDQDTGTPVTQSFDIAPGAKVTPQFDGMRGGPVELKAYKQGGTWPTDKRNVIASQRVLSSGGTAFNEVPGIPAGELSNRYLWTWYDQLSAGAANWVLVANPNSTDVIVTVKVAGETVVEAQPLAAGQIMTPQFDGKRGGPVEVTSSGGNVIASQRVLWGASFEEKPGIPASTSLGGVNQLDSAYNWTWYDEASPGSANWVLVSNTDAAASVYFELTKGSDVLASGTIAANSSWTGDFPTKIGGPLQVKAWTDGTKTTPVTDKVIASQRVLWNGYFNEVEGTSLK